MILWLATSTQHWLFAQYQQVAGISRVNTIKALQTFYLFGFTANYAHYDECMCECVCVHVSCTFMFRPTFMILAEKKQCCFCYFWWAKYCLQICFALPSSSTFQPKTVQRFAFFRKCYLWCAYDFLRYACAHDSWSFRPYICNKSPLFMLNEWVIHNIAKILCFPVKIILLLSDRD